MTRARLEPLRLAFSVPPQHYKTETVSHWLAQLLGVDPALRLVYTTYNQTIAERKALKVHDYAMVLGVQPDPRMANRQDWQTLAGGSLIARGRGAGITGEPADVIVADDLLKDRKEAESATIRQDAWDFITDVLLTRLNERGVFVMFFTRWHEDDPIGRVIKHMADEFTIIRLPALADHLDVTGTQVAPDPLGRALGEALLPQQKSRESLEKIRDNPATAKSFYSLSQGLPRDDKTRIFRGVHYYQEIPTDGYRVIFGMDGAYSKKKAADKSALGKGRFKDGKLYVENVIYAQTTAGDWGKQVKPLVGGHEVRWRGSGVESGVADLLPFKVRFDTLSEDKLANNTAVATAWNDGLILMPDPDLLPNPWLEPVLEELWAFTGVNDPKDDFVDMIGNMWDEAAASKPKRRTVYPSGV